MKDALITCNVLEEIKVVISLPYDTGLGRYIRHPDGKQICYPFKEHETNWLAAIRILALLPSKRLHSATVSLRGTSTDAHILAWDQLRTWCSSVPRLAEVNVELEQAFDQRRCLVYEMQGFERIFTPRFIPPRNDIIVRTHSLPDRLGIAAYQCWHDGCGRYQAELAI